MNVLHLAAGNLYGGIERMLVAFAAHRTAVAGLDQAFACCFGGRLETELRATGAPVHRLPETRLKSPGSIRRARVALDRVLQETRCDAAIAHAAWTHVLFGGVARRAGLPLVFWMHDFARGLAPLELLARWTRPELVVCNSQAVAASADRVFPRTPRTVIHCAVELAPHPRDPASRRQTRASADTAPDDLVLIQVSRMEAWKGHALLLEALARVRSATPWTCWMVGGAQRPSEARYLAALERQARQLGLAARVRFLGQRTDVPALLAAADVHCQPNTGPEPFGITFVEALVQGLPVVTTALGGALEIVDASCGVLVPPGDAAALAAALTRLLEDAALRARLGQGGPPRARALCDPPARLVELARRLTDLALRS